MLPGGSSATFPAIMGVGTILLLLACQPAFSAGNSSGQAFVVVFPENIAYYHPNPPTNQLLVTALFNNTNVNIKNLSRDVVPQKTVSSGEVLVVTLSSVYTLNRANVSDRVIHITSTKNVTVYAVINMTDSTQTFQIPPVDSLGTEYYIPVLPPRVTAGSSRPSSSSASPWQFTDPSSSPFYLLVVNTGTQNEVSVVGSQKMSVSLLPFQVAQWFMDQNHTLVKVSAQNPVLVLLSHPCFPRSNCSCSMLLTPLSPSLAWGKTYLLPPALGDNNSVLLLTDKTDSKYSPSLLAFSPGQLSYSEPVSLIIQEQGRLFSLLPVEAFSSCFMSYYDPTKNRQALLVAPSMGNISQQVRMDNLPLRSTWQNIAGTGYSWTLVPLMTTRSVFWHTSSQIAVYLSGDNRKRNYGSAAMSISSQADYRGCVLTPGNLTVGDDEVSWTDAVQYCRDQGLELISLGDNQLQQQLTPPLTKSLRDKGSKRWIGLRRSSLTGDWYWLNTAPLGTTLWGDGEPGDSENDQCAVMGLGPNAQLSWSDQSCCEKARPVCYKDPLLFSFDQSV